MRSMWERACSRKPQHDFKSDYCIQCNTQLSSIQLMAIEHKAQARGLAWVSYHSE
ncbi:hypothetical protein EMIT0P291_120126 [Pseudomonas sp. IT-P291]